MSDQLIPVPAEWATRAFVDNGKYLDLYKASVNDPVSFWREQGKRIDWIKPYSKVKNVSYDAKDLFIRWYEDGALNVSANCTDRHLAKRADQTAIIWEGDDPKDSKHITYRQLHEEVCRFANVLKANGPGAIGTITPMIPDRYAMSRVRSGRCIRSCSAGSRRTVWRGGFSTVSRMS
jgi:acetyl-CoA synthetase